MTGVPPASRNAPCPCGSGRRYKECHGAIAALRDVPPPDLDRVAQAARAFAGGDHAGAAALCDAVLKDDPGHPAALELLARRETEAGRPLTALSLLIDAARGLSRHPVPPDLAYGVWTALNGAFLDAVSGQDAKAAEARRAAYRAWQAQRGASALEAARDVAVVVVLTPATAPDAARWTLDSLLAQTLPPAELVIVSVGVSPAMPSTRAWVATMPFPARIVDVPAATLAAACDVGVAHARAAWVVIVEPPHAFAPEHLAAMVAGVAGRGARWGFSDCLPEPFGEVPAATIAQRAASNDATGTSIAKADALGFAFIDQSFAATGSGAVLFARDLPARVGGFRPLAGHEMWDFCLRALWEDEPVHVAERTYRHAITAADAVRPAAEREAAQVAIYRDYYARACREDATPPNRFAPSLPAWGLAFVRRMFQVGHVLMVDVDTLERLRGHVASVAEAAAPPSLTPGINLIGFAFGEFGLGESMRALARACEAGAIPFVVKDIEQHLATRQADRSVARHLSDDIRHRLSLMCVNPDMLKPVRALLERTRAGGGRSVGYWYWELDTVPRTWDAALAVVDEVWCATEFVATAIRRATAKPVVKISPPIEVALQRTWDRSHFRLPAHRQLFLFTFDYNSFVKRKNPEAVIAAFRAAFPPGRDDVGLVLKSVNGVRRPERVAAITALIAGDARIVHLDRFLSRDESFGLIDATDVYVSLHRAEGLGLGLAEAMALGKPTIATGYSGNLEFMNEGNSLLVDYRIVPVAPGDYLVDDERFVWADPDVDDAARHMRALADDPRLRARLAVAGQRDIRKRFSRERVAEMLRRRLEELEMPEASGSGAASRASTAVSAVGAGARTDVPGPFVSYAQNGEDALLGHVLAGVQCGFYVDVGANDPDVHSVTRAFYERGWRGVNVEPVAQWHERLCRARPGDVNLQVAAGRKRGSIVLHEFAGTGLSTVDADVAARHERSGRAAHALTVAAWPLAEIFDAHAAGDVHFLKIDVEGAESAVLAGADFRRHRPWIVVVEATQPLTGVASHQAWEPRLLDAGYRFAHDDGLNRYYVSDEHAELVGRFADGTRAPVVRAAELTAAAADLAPERCFDPGNAAFLDRAAPEPTLAQPSSQLCTVRQFREAAYREQCAAIREPPMLGRQQWEQVWILRCLEHAGMLVAGRRGLGFRCGRGPLAAAMAARGCAIVATGADADRPSGRPGDGLDELNERGICAPERFRDLVSLRPADMNALPDDLEGFDFVWSASALEGLGSIERGLSFVMRAMRCLRPGGVAVHTTVFNLSSNGPTLESPDLSIVRRQDIERLCAMLAREGHRAWPVNLQPGADPADRHVDVPPYRAEPHLKVRFGRFVVTSIGLAIERSA